jgi:hypothetical protein
VLAQDKKHVVTHMTWKLELIERQKLFMQSLWTKQEEELNIAEAKLWGITDRRGITVC